MSYGSIAYGELIYADYVDPPEIPEGWEDSCKSKSTWGAQSKETNNWSDSTVQSSAWTDFDKNVISTTKCKE